VILVPSASQRVSQALIGVTHALVHTKERFICSPSPPWVESAPCCFLCPLKFQFVIHTLGFHRPPLSVCGSCTVRTKHKIFFGCFCLKFKLFPALKRSARFERPWMAPFSCPPSAHSPPPPCAKSRPNFKFPSERFVAARFFYRFGARM
jgi:hypothetical protein